jgi:hypothetical protein
MFVDLFLSKHWAKKCEKLSLLVAWNYYICYFSSNRIVVWKQCGWIVDQEETHLHTSLKAIQYVSNIFQVLKC